MSHDHDADAVEFDDLVTLALAQSTEHVAPRAEVKQALLAKLHGEPTVPAGFSFAWDADPNWMPHPVPGIRMKVLSLNHRQGYATLLLDVAPGTHFPSHHHGAAEECYVVSGSLHTCGRRLGAGDFVHADADTEHGELYTVEGCRVLLVVEPEEFMLASTRQSG
jgi:anti-sigma factor ChrR (cupin superfamily)